MHAPVFMLKRIRSKWSLAPDGQRNFCDVLDHDNLQLPNYHLPIRAPSTKARKGVRHWQCRLALLLTTVEFAGVTAV